VRAPAPIPVFLRDLATRQSGLVTAEQCVRLGVSGDRRTGFVQRGELSRVVRGVYLLNEHGVPDPSPDLARQRAAWTALLAYGTEAIAVGKCALALHGVLGLPVSITPEAAVSRGRDRTDRDGIRLREFDNGMETVEIDGRRVVTVEWALAQAVPELDRRHAVAVMDSALHLGFIDEKGLERAHRLARGRRGVAKTHEWWCLADRRAESPLETFGRLDCLDLGIPPDDLQVKIFDRNGRFLGRGDMGWRLDDGRWLIAEMDGREFHDEPDALYRDRRRQNDLAQLADLLRFASADVYSGAVGSTVRRHLRLHGRTRGSSAKEVK